MPQRGHHERCLNWLRAFPRPRRRTWRDGDVGARTCPEDPRRKTPTPAKRFRSSAPGPLAPVTSQRSRATGRFGAGLVRETHGVVERASGDRRGVRSGASNDQAKLHLTESSGSVSQAVSRVDPLEVTGDAYRRGARSTPRKTALRRCDMVVVCQVGFIENRATMRGRRGDSDGSSKEARPEPPLDLAMATNSPRLSGAEQSTDSRPEITG